MPPTIKAAEAMMTASEPGVRARVVALTIRPIAKLATGLVDVMAATAGGNGPVANAICASSSPPRVLTSSR
jgi:hypothetical protein